MADNVPITAGSGTTVSTEEVTTLNGVTVTAQHVQRVAAAFRTADGVASDAATGAGAVGASVQRTTLASDDPAVAGIGATNSSAAANPSATAGLNGVIKGMWTALVAGIGAIGDTAWASGNGSVIALLKTVATAAKDTTTPVPVKDAGAPYEVVAVSQTDQILGTTGAAGDVLAWVRWRAGASPTDIVIKDGSTTIFTIKAAAQVASTEGIEFFGAVAATAWKVTTSTGSSAVCGGTFV